ncbi:MAG TPA: malectin domain-containing carbohydrate-binding protein, partial [bacterium]|nr:malectin domain-containing carbohydrate-binding protein [bacterium]
EVTRELYEGMFQRVMKAYPVDYYWLWTPEGWIWEGTGAEEIKATQTDLLAAVDAAKKVSAPFTLATCGWVLGPQTDRALFHRLLPLDMPMSCINREVGKAPVQPDFARLKNRPSWAIPWLEDDPALLQPQLWVGRMRADAVDAKAYGCTGLMGIHWRTRILGPNVSALAWAAWDQQDWYDPATDPSIIPETEGVVGGQWIASPTAEIQKTEDDELYRTVRDAVRSYHIAVPQGKYAVTLQFCAPESSLFAVAIEGKNVLEKLDIAAAAGPNTALDYTFPDIPVEDGRLDIEFSPMVKNPSIAALVIQSDSFTKKINCGGEAYQDYQADWPPSKPKPRHLPSEDFYQDWALRQFGPAAANEIAAVFTSLDGNLPRPSDWVDGPGGIKPDPRPWETVQHEYEFVGKLESLRSKIQGQGSRERFDYWLNSFRFLRSLGRINCEWAALNQAIQKAKDEPDAARRRALARREALPIRIQLIQTVNEAYGALLATVSNTGEMGTV